MPVYVYNFFSLQFIRRRQTSCGSQSTTICNPHTTDVYLLLWQVIDFHAFEEMFKLDSVTLADMDIDGTLPGNKTLTMKRPEAITLLEPNRMRNVGK